MTNDQLKLKTYNAQREGTRVHGKRIGELGREIK